jgi:hypothetical protein
VLHLAVTLVRHAGLSFRGTAAALAVFATQADAMSPPRMPCATTVRSWVLRLGYAQLTRPLPHSQRWAWLIDHTIQIGSQKLFVILGVLLDEAPFGVRPLQLSDLHLVAMVPMSTSDQQRIDAELENAVARTGAPRQIVCDGAADLHRGIERFQVRHPKTATLSDVAHVVANLLEHYWQNDPAWVAFVRRMSETAAAIRQTRCAHLLAPKLRNKTRFMSVAKFVRFGRIVAGKLRAATPEADVVKHYGWVAEYEAALQAWHEQHELVQTTLRSVRVEGVFARSVTLLDEEWQRLAPSDHPITTKLRHRLRAYVSRCSRAAQPGERLIASTEILESAFGVQKRLSRDQSESGLTGLSVGLGAMLGTATPQQMQADVDRIPEKAVQGWAKKTLGSTVQWLRRQFLRPDSPPENSVPNPG